MKFKSEKGQAMVEFALILPILLLFIGGIIDFGWIFHNQIVANNASREAARYLAVHYYYPGGDIKGDLNSADIKATAMIKSDCTSFYEDSIDATITKSPDDTVTGEKIKVYFKGNIDVLTPFLSTILGDDVYEIDSECTMRIEK